MRHVLYLLSSARKMGNSEQLARQTIPAGAHVEWRDLAQLEIPAFRDQRPATPEIAPILQDLLPDLCRSDDIVFVAPVYWYALPAPAKLFLDHWSGFLDDDALRFKDRISGKRLWLVSSRADPNPDVPRAMEAMLRQSGEWLGMVWGGALHGVGDAPGEIRMSPEWQVAPGFLTQSG